MDRTAILNTYVTDMAAVEAHILQAVDHQVSSDDTARYPAAASVLTALQGTLRGHVAALEAYNASTEGGGLKEAVKEAVGTALGFAAGIYNHIRSEDKVSRMLRDTYTALGLAAISYEMLHTTALALRDDALARLALTNLGDLTKTIGDLSRAIVDVVVAELTDEDKTIDAGVAGQAVENTQEAWRRS